MIKQNRMNKTIKSSRIKSIKETGINSVIIIDSMEQKFNSTLINGINIKYYSNVYHHDCL